MSVQATPFPTGGGLVQVLVLCCTPPPQVTLHFDQVVHLVYPPSTAER